MIPLWGVPPNYLPETKTLIAAMTVAPTSARATLINNLIGALQSSGTWVKLDTFYMLADQADQPSRLNWINPAANTITAVNSPTFTVDRGWQGDGATSYLNTNFASNGGGSPKYTANAAHAGLWSRTDGISAVTGGGDFGDNTSTNRLSFGIKNISGNTVYRPNAGGSGAVVAPASAIGHFVLDIATNAQTIYKNGASYGTDTVVTGAATSTQYIGASNVGGVPVFSARQYAAYHAGGTLLPADVAALYGVINTFLQAIGAA